MRPHLLAIRRFLHRAGGTLSKEVASTGVLEPGRAVALRVQHVGIHVAWAQDGHLEAGTLQSQFIIQRLRKAHHAMLAHLVTALTWAIDEARHGGGIDNMTFGLLLEHARDKEVDAMNHAP